MPHTVLIVSSGRTGTRFLACYFGANFADVAACHEPAPRASLRLASNAYAAGAAGALSRGALLAMLRRRKRRRIDRSGARIYIESNPMLWGAIDLFDEGFGQPTVVHVIRDPRQQVRSSLNHGTSRGFKAIANRWLPYWNPGVMSVAAQRGSFDWGSFDWLAGTATLWAVVNQRLHDEGARCRDYHRVRYEDLFDASHSGLRTLCDRLGLAYRGAGAEVDPSVPINRGTRDVLPEWRSWRPQQCATLDRICGPLMRSYGYGMEPEWRAAVEAERGAT